MARRRSDDVTAVTSSAVPQRPGAAQTLVTHSYPDWRNNHVTCRYQYWTTVRVTYYDFDDAVNSVAVRAECDSIRCAIPASLDDDPVVSHDPFAARRDPFVARHVTADSNAKHLHLACYTHRAHTTLLSEQH